MFDHIAKDQPCTAKDVRLVEGTRVGWDGFQTDHAWRLASTVQVGKPNTRSNGDKNGALQRGMGLPAP